MLQNSAVVGGLVGLLVGLGPSVSQAQSEQPAALPNKYHVTEAERAACQSDAITLCSVTFPDEDRLLQCMRTNHASLSTGCQSVFDAGLKRRHIPL